MVHSGYLLYLLKAVAASVSAFALSNWLVPRDVISGTFVAVLCLQPTFSSSFVSGFQQLIASFLGAILSVIIIYFGGGTTLVGLALAMFLTLFLLKALEMGQFSRILLIGPESWTIAAFTVIYFWAFGKMSMSITEIFNSRFLSVLIGIIVAVFINFVFSFFQYKKQFNKWLWQLDAKFLPDIYNYYYLLQEAKTTVQIQEAMDSLRGLFAELNYYRQELKKVRKENRRKGRPISGDLAFYDAHSTQLGRLLSKSLDLGNYINHLKDDSELRLQVNQILVDVLPKTRKQHELKHPSFIQKIKIFFVSAAIKETNIFSENISLTSKRVESILNSISQIVKEKEKSFQNLEAIYFNGIILSLQNIVLILKELQTVSRE